MVKCINARPDPELFLVARDGGVQAAGVNIKAIVRTQRSTNHGGMGAPWGVRVVGRCLGHRLFSSYFVL